MRRRHESRLVGGRSKIYATREHLVEEAVEALAVALHDFGEARRRRSRGSTSRTCCRSIAPRSLSRLLRVRPSTSWRVVASTFSWKPALPDDLQRRETRRHCDRIARERAGLVHGPERRDLLHDVAPAAERAQRQAAADDLAERGEVGLHAVSAPARRRARRESRSSLRRGSARAVARAFLAQGFEKAGRGQHQVHVSGDGLDDDAGDFGPWVAKKRFQCGNIVVVQNQRCAAAVSGGTPAELGLPKVRAPEPALTSSESAWPW